MFDVFMFLCYDCHAGLDWTALTDITSSSQVQEENFLRAQKAQ